MLQNEQQQLRWFNFHPNGQQQHEGGGEAHFEGAFKLDYFTESQ
jgi:hypothetical protein